MCTDRRFVAVATTLLALAASRVAAQPKPEPPAATWFDEVTVVADKSERSLGETPARVTVIHRRDLDRALAHNGADLLAGEPAASATGEAGRFGLLGFRLRGMDGNRVAVEMDGAPAPDFFTVGSFSRAGRGAIDPELLESVEILHGPASAVHGSDALGGVILLTTESAADLLDAGSQLSSSAAFRLRTSFDGRDAGRRGGLSAAFSVADWKVLLSAAARRSDESSNVGATPPDPLNAARRSGLLKMSRVANRWFAELTGGIQDERTESDVRHLRFTTGAFATTASLLGDDRVDEQRGALYLAVTPAAAHWSESSLRATFGRSETRQDTVQERRPAAPAALADATRVEREFAWDQDTRGLELLNHLTSQIGSTAHQWVLGARLQQQDFDELRDGREINLRTGATTNLLLGERLPVRDFPRSTTTRSSVFVADSIVSPSGRWRVDPALRWELDRTTASPDALLLADNPNFVAADTEARRFTPRLGATFDAGRGHVIYAQAASGFRAPPVSDVNLAFAMPTLGYAAIANPDLKPETSVGYELGWRRSSARGTLAATAYDNRYRDLIESRVNLGRDPQSGLIHFQSRNRQRARISGVEAHARATRATLGGATWTWDAALSIARGRDLERDQPLSTVDPPRLVASLTYAAPSGRWGWQSVLRASDDARTDRSLAPVHEPPAFAVIDWLAHRQIGRHVEVNAGLRNLFDAKYWEFSRVGKVLSTDSQLDFYTEPGRSAQMGVTVRF